MYEIDAAFGGTSFCIVWCCSKARSQELLGNVPSLISPGKHPGDASRARAELNQSLLQIGGLTRIRLHVRSLARLVPEPRCHF